MAERPAYRITWPNRPEWSAPLLVNHKPQGQALEFIERSGGVVEELVPRAELAAERDRCYRLLLEAPYRTRSKKDSFKVICFDVLSRIRDGEQPLILPGASGAQPEGAHHG